MSVSGDETKTLPVSKEVLLVQLTPFSYIKKQDISNNHRRFQIPHVNIMKRPNPEYIKRIHQVVNLCPYFELLSMKLQDVGIDYSVLEIDLAKKHLQPFGMVHGGVFASIIDAAAFWSIYFGIEDQSAGLTTVDLKLNYLAPAASGKLIARGRRIKIGSTLGYAEAEVTDETGKILTHDTSTVIILPGKAIEADPPLPPKFIE
jgi:uncharacterized protein (TIGR00369 family)